jgi:capsular polysaccharide biosynthesis protein
MDKLLFWLGIGAAQKSSQSKPIDSRNWVVSLVVGTLVAALVAVGMFLLLVNQKL